MRTMYETIYEMAKPYLNTRYNDVHVELSYEFTKRLLKHYPEADEDIVLPAILLHDVGWKMVPEDEQAGAFGPEVKKNDVQRFHEIEGAKMAGQILNELNYPGSKIHEIMDIIDGHDTRLEALSLNDKIVKDADKLWRFTTTGVNIDSFRFGIERISYINYLEDRIKEWFFTLAAQDMARETLAITRSQLS
ncbi:MAG: HD domain-containing protein [Syntrophorhabdus sp.]|nr:HD domain-containing protein [Syntrophorhabdus sp.]